MMMMMMTMLSLMMIQILGKPGQAFRAIAALELYASLLCLVPFAPCFDEQGASGLVLQGTTDNQSNKSLGEPLPQHQVSELRDPP